MCLCPHCGGTIELVKQADSIAVPNVTRGIKRIVWHCSATKEGVDVSAATIRKWHVDGRGWRDIGYHYVIELDGAIKQGRPLQQTGAHVSGHNGDSVGICYVGGLASDGKTPKDTRTPAQKRALYSLTQALIDTFPGSTVHGHNEFAAKACPSFNAQLDWQQHLASRL